MRSEDVAPKPAAFIESLRAIGYSFDTAIADIIDNSVAALASNVWIGFEVKPDAVVTVLDDGIGMSERTLIEAMRFGGAGPGLTRSAQDLGRYGLGLKTASLSQCRRLTVASVANSSFAAARWDLDIIARENDWKLEVLSREDLRQSVLDELDRLDHGTLIIWENLDRALAGSNNSEATIKQLIDDTRWHLGLVFHRYIEGRDARKLEISINGVQVAAIDPFMIGNKKTQALPREVIKHGGSLTTIQPYVLPHMKHMRREDIAAAQALDERLRRNQGCYIYRNKRLVAAGSWFRISELGELSKLARVRIDIGNEQDAAWDLDIKKSSAKPPEFVRASLKRIIGKITGPAKRVLQGKVSRLGLFATPIWERHIEADGISYAVNLKHPVVSRLLDGAGENERALLRDALGMIGRFLPADRIYSDLAEDNYQELPDISEDEIRSWINDMLRVVDDIESKHRMLDAIPTTKPFSDAPELTQKVLEELRSSEELRSVTR